MTIITNKELNNLNNILKDIYEYVDRVDINNRHIYIYYVEGNPNRAIKSVIPYHDEDLKEILKNLIKYLDIEFSLW